VGITATARYVLRKGSSARGHQWHEQRESADEASIDHGGKLPHRLQRFNRFHRIRLFHHISGHFYVK
jgi:hypothetical protein